MEFRRSERSAVPSPTLAHLVQLLIVEEMVDHNFMELGHSVGIGGLELMDYV